MSVHSSTFSEAFVDVSSRGKKIPKSQFKEAGGTPIVDQGRTLVAGYTDDVTESDYAAYPAIVFGDHTRAIKFVDHPFMKGADGVKVLQAREGFNLKFLYYFLLSLDMEAAGYSRHFRFLKGIRVPRIDKRKQDQAVQLFDRVATLKRQLAELSSDLESLVFSTFEEMFGHAEDQSRVPIGAIAKVYTGSTPSRKRTENYGGDVPWVKTGEIVGTITATGETLTPAGMRSARLQLYSAGSVVIAMYGEGRTRGKSAVLGLNAAVNQACAVIPPNSNIDPYFLQTQLAYRYEELRNLGRGGTQANLNLRLIESFPILVPPMTEQLAFASVATRIRAGQDLTRRAIALAKEVERSCQATIFEARDEQF